MTYTDIHADEAVEPAPATPVVASPSPPPDVAAEAGGTDRLPLKRLFLLALVATLAVAALVLVDVSRFGGNPVSLVQPGAQGPSHAAFAHDFPQLKLPNGLGFDGQQFYAIARQPLHLTKVAPDLDRPRYRLQRPLLAWLAWVVHPGGGGVGLVQALLLVGILTTIMGAMSMGAISWTLGRRTWPAAVYPLLPGCYVCLRVSVADALGLSFALLAIALALRSRWALAVVAGVAAVLGKEVAILVLVGFALWWRAAGRTTAGAGPGRGLRLGRRVALSARDLQALALVAVPAAVAATWWFALRIMLPNGGGQINEIVPPFVGLARSVRLWSHHRELSGMVSDLATVAVAGLVLARKGRRSPFFIAIVIQLLFITTMNVSVIAMNLSGTRATLALAALAILAIAVPGTPSAPASPHEGLGAVGHRVGGAGEPATMGTA